MLQTTRSKHTFTLLWLYAFATTMRVCSFNVNGLRALVPFLQAEHVVRRRRRRHARARI